MRSLTRGRSTPALRSGRSCCVTALRTCRQEPASSPTRTRRPSTRNVCASSPRSRRRSISRRPSNVDPARRQLRLVHLQPRAPLRRAGRERGRTAKRRARRGSGRAPRSLRPRGVRDGRGRRDHGGAAPDARRLRRAVPSGIRPHPPGTSDRAKLRGSVIQTAITRLLDGIPLERGEARAVMDEIMVGEATPAQIGGFLVALRAKGETPDEIAGCAEAMRAHVLSVKPCREDLVDTAGTGGDGARTINISTAAALVAAAAGAAVAKHGNRAVSSACGSADVLEALGFSLEQGPERISQSIDELGFGFLFAPSHHPAMRHAAPVRTELATRTVFNILGPLTNPAGARAQVVGVYSPALVRTIAEVLARLGARRAFVVHGAGGIDELSPVGANLVCAVVDGNVRERELDPEAELGIPHASVEELRGGSPNENAQAIRDVFAGADGGRRSAILLNAAGAIAAGGHAEDLREGLELARQAVDSGAASARLEELISFSRAEEVSA